MFTSIFGICCGDECFNYKLKYLISKRTNRCTAWTQALLNIISTPTQLYLVQPCIKNMHLERTCILIYCANHMHTCTRKHKTDVCM